MTTSRNRKPKKKKASQPNPAPVAEEYVEHKHSVRTGPRLTQPYIRAGGANSLATKPSKTSQTQSSNAETPGANALHGQHGHSVTQSTDHTQRDGAQSGAILSPLPAAIVDLIQVYERTCELAQQKLASIAPLLHVPRPRPNPPSGLAQQKLKPPSEVQHQMVLVSPSEHKDYSDAAEMLPDARRAYRGSDRGEASANTDTVQTVKHWAAKMFKAQDRTHRGVITAHEFGRTFQVLEQKIFTLALSPQNNQSVCALLHRVRDAVMLVANPGVGAPVAVQYDQALRLFDEAIAKGSQTHQQR